MNERTFWIGIWSIVATFLIALAIVVSIHSLKSHSRFLKALEMSDDPIAIACAYDIKYSTATQRAPECIVREVK